MASRLSGGLKGLSPATHLQRLGDRFHRTRRLVADTPAEVTSGNGKRADQRLARRPTGQAQSAVTPSFASHSRRRGTSGAPEAIERLVSGYTYPPQYNKAVGRCAVCALWPGIFNSRHTWPQVFDELNHPYLSRPGRIPAGTPKAQ